MKLLVVTQKVDAADANLGFFIRWIEEFANQCESVLVVCLEKGVCMLPPNVRVLSLGKEKSQVKGRGLQILPRALYALRLLRYIVIERGSYDAVFVHMNPEYALIGGLAWKLLGKKTALWYVHKKVSWRLRLAALFVHRIFTASHESCRLRNKKVEIVGHGIAASFFVPRGEAPRGLRLITAGRVAPVKDIRTMILGFLELRKRFPDATLSIVGEPITGADRVYYEELRGLSIAVQFLGGVPHEELPRLLREATAFVHASRTGSIDKAVLEALATGLPVFSSSVAFPEQIPGVVKFQAGSSKDLAEKITVAFERGEIGYNEKGREWVITHHNLDNLIKKIVGFYIV